MQESDGWPSGEKEDQIERTGKDLCSRRKMHKRTEGTGIVLESKKEGHSKVGVIWGKSLVGS